MHQTLLILLALAATSMGIALPQQSPERRDALLNTAPGCNPYTDPSVILYNQNSVAEDYSTGGPALTQADLTTCLNEYGCGTFSTSWNGNVCGGRGWFKGPPSSENSTQCYQDLAPYVLERGIGQGYSYYKAGLKHCYMGYNDPGPDSSTQ